MNLPFGLASGPRRLEAQSMFEAVTCGVHLKMSYPLSSGLQ